ncbi:MAG: hypothetical protein JW940_27095 [Polyangiaceae bacterium]|nr:hypothetical protein [Polyangiaceae bacterium]
MRVGSTLAAGILLGTLLFWACLSLNPLQVHGLPVFLRDRPAHHVYSAECFDLNSEILIRTKVAFGLQGSTPARGLSFRISKLWMSHPEQASRELLEPGVTARHVSPYRSSFNLQGDLWLAFARTLHLRPESAWAWARGLSCALTAAAIAIWAAWLWRHLSPTASVFVAAFVPMSPLVLWAPNTFRVPWTSLLPFAVLWWIYPYAAKARGGWYCLLGGILATATLGFLCSLEFASVIAASMAVPIVFHERNSGASWMRVARPVLAVAGVTTLGLLAAVVALCARVSGSLSDLRSGLQHIGNRAAAWTGKETSLVSDVLGIAKTGALNGLTLFGPVALPAGILALASVVWLVVYFVRRGRAHPLGESGLRERSLMEVTLFAMLASLSWFVLQPHHIAFHPRFGLWLLTFPWFLVAVAALGHALRRTEHSPAKEEGVVRG